MVKGADSASALKNNNAPTQLRNNNEPAAYVPDGGDAMEVDGAAANGTGLPPP